MLIAVPLMPQQRDNAGIGTIKSAFSGTEATPSNDNLMAGVAFLNNRFWVTSGGGGVGGVPQIYEFDTSGNYIANFADPSITVAATTTLDMATDGTVLFVGTDVGVTVVDPSTQALATSVMAANGPQAITNPIAGAGLTTLMGTFRGVAYDPGGNGGNGSLYVGNIDANAPGTLPILEIDLAGNVLQTFANVGGYLASGLALDPRSGNLWVNTGPPDLNGRFGTIMELDASNMFQPTGVEFAQIRKGPFQGGLDKMDPGSSQPYASDFDLVALTRLNGEDWVVTHRVHLFPGLPGSTEAFLEGSVNMNPMTTGSLGTIAANDTLNYRVNAGNSPAMGFPAFVFINAGTDAEFDFDNFNPFAGGALVPELRVQSAFSTPPSLGTLLDFSSVGTLRSIPIPGSVLSCFRPFRLQAVYIEPRAPGTPPIMTTNEIFVNPTIESGCNVVVEAVGANSVTYEAARPFWQVIQTGGPAITAITFDAELSNGLARELVWDTDSGYNAGAGGPPPLNYRFVAGNATGPACTGTYRGTDVTCGLIYDALNTPPDPCNPPPAGNSGFIASNSANNGSGVPPNRTGWRTLRFRFNNFQGGTPASPKIFGFDCDTDILQVLSGDGHAGLVVLIEFANGVTRGLELFVDPLAANRAVGGVLEP